MTMPAGVSLAQLLAAPLALTAQDAVAVIVQLARSPQTGRPRSVALDASHVWLDRDGTAALAPGLLPSLSEFAALLDRLLSPLGDGVPRGLRAIVERAAAHGQAGTIPTLSAFAAALVPFQPPDPAAAVSALVARLDGPRAVAAAPAASTPASARPAASPRPVSPPPVVVPAAASSPVMVVPAAASLTGDSRAMPAATVPDVVPLPDRPPPADPGSEWRPSLWAVALAIAATALAGVLGGSLARTRDAGPPAAEVSMPAPTVASRAAPPEPEWEPEPVRPPAAAEAVGTGSPAPAAPAEPAEPGPAPDPAPDRVPDRAAPEGVVPDLAVAPDPAAEGPATAEPAARQPARLLDRRDVQADAVYSPSFARNGTAVFFHAESRRGSALKRADAGGGELRVASIVDDGARNYHVQVSPDGSQVAFDSDRDGVRGVYVADADGRDVRRVSGPGYAAVPTWSPDGGRLAFIRGEPERPAVWNLWLLDRESGRQHRVTAFRRGQVWGGAWFADGQRIVYSHEDRLTIHDLATGRSRDIASPLPGRQVRTPAVSPDGRWIVFQVYRDGVWLFDVEDGAMRRVLDDASAEEFAWSPDGRRVAYHSRRSGGWNLWTMTAP